MTDNKYMPWPADPGEYIKVTLYKGNRPVREHKHDFIEIVFINGGSCVHNYLGTEAVLIPGDTFIVVPHEQHSYKINSDTVIYNCLFYPEALGDDWKLLGSVGGIFDMLMVEPFYRQEVMHQAIIHLSAAEAAYFTELLERMRKEQEQCHTDFRFIQKANLMLLLSFLGRAWEKQREANQRLYNGKREMLSQAFQFIETNIREEIKISELASRVYLSTDYFRKVFKEVSGLTPIEFINKLRIDKASSLLLDENMSVSAVAESVGIHDVNYFSRLFKNLKGCAPSDWRKINKEKLSINDRQ